jgi:hypothetical protein
VWFKKHSTPRIPSTPSELNDRELNPVVSALFAEGSPAREKVGPVAAAGYENAPVQREYDEFCATFCHQPGRNLMRDYVVAEGDRRLSAWLDWQHGHEPEARAFVRLMLGMIRAGENIWDQTGISMFRQGQWSIGGVPSAASQQALSVIAQLIAKRITVIYKSSATAADAKVLRFEP